MNDAQSKALRDYLRDRPDLLAEVLAACEADAEVLEFFLIRAGHFDIPDTMTQNETAAALGLTLPQVRYAESSALKKLRNACQAHGIEHDMLRKYLWGLE